MRVRAIGLLSLAAALAFSLGAKCGKNPTPPWTSPHEPVGRALFASPQAQPLALTPDGSRLYVAATTSGVVTVIDTAGPSVLVERLRVGIDPVAVAVRPDGAEVWVANHVSDSVSVNRQQPGEPHVSRGDRDHPGLRRRWRDAPGRARGHRVRQQHQGLRGRLFHQRDRRDRHRGRLLHGAIAAPVRLGAGPPGHRRARRPPLRGGLRIGATRPRSRPA